MARRIILTMGSLVAIINTLQLIYAYEIDKNETVFFNPLFSIVISAMILTITSILILTFLKSQAEKHKKIFFIIMVAPIAISTAYLVFTTVYGNIISETNGPVHWHADYKVLTCGKELDLINPKFPSNKIGTPLFHEHDDNRIHIEGVVNNLSDVSLSEYFKVIGGEITPISLKYPTHKETIYYKDGDICFNSEIPGKLKVYINGKKSVDFEEYIVYPTPNVPSGDCIVILFDSSNEETTDIICESWKARGWNYEQFKREKINIGGRTWQ